MNTKKLVAHRGDNTNYPENSYAAIEAALIAGANFIEFDIQMNADQTLIVFHDNDFKRMANTNALVFETSDATMKNISAHEPEQFSELHYPTRISHLGEILTLLKRYPAVQAFVEIKRQSLEFWGVKTVMKKLLAGLEDFTKQAIIISYSERALRYTQKNSLLKTGLVFDQYIKINQRVAENIDPDYLICPYDIIPGKNLWKGNWQWMVYSINEVPLVKQLLAREDIQLIETDDINLMLNT